MTRDRYVPATREAVSPRKSPWASKGPDRLVVHVTEGSLDGAVRWGTYSRQQRAESFLRRRGGTLEGWLASPLTFPTAAHYYFGEDGRCVQMVDDHLKCFHANSYNSRSIGFEHEGVTAKGGFPDAMLLKSAKCAAVLAHKFGWSVDRTHIIGHNEVPGAKHTDPGPHWPWDRYMEMVLEAHRGLLTPG